MSQDVQEEETKAGVSPSNELLNIVGGAWKHNAPPPTAQDVINHLFLQKSQPVMEVSVFKNMFFSGKIHQCKFNLECRL